MLLEEESPAYGDDLRDELIGSPVIIVQVRRHFVASYQANLSANPVNMISVATSSPTTPFVVHFATAFCH
jgi:hypothetical protein